MRNKLFLFMAALFMVTFIGCEPFEADDITLPELPAAPDFTFSELDGDPNIIVFEDISSGYFSRTWDFGENIDEKKPNPPTSTLKNDTVNFSKAGTYEVTLHVSAEGGAGTASVTKSIVIENDGTVSCDDQVALLTGDCDVAGKCWVFSTAAGAVSVGPTPGSSEWFSSPAGGLALEQYDDSWCFFIDGLSFMYNNNGQTIDPFNGYVAVDYTPPTDYTWVISAGAGENGEDRIVLPDGAFMGVWDCGPFYDIITLTETELVVRSPTADGAGWFELSFVAQ